MQYNTTSASSSPAATSATATHNYFSGAVDINGFNIPQVPLAGPSHQPISSSQVPKIPGLLSRAKAGSIDEAEVSEHAPSSPLPTPQQFKVACSVAPSPTPTTLPHIHKDVEHLHALEAEQAEEIRTLTKEVLAEAFTICLPTPGDLASHYCCQIAKLLGEGVVSRISEDAEELRETGKLPVRTLSWDARYLEPRQFRAATAVSTPKRSIIPPPPPSTIPSRKCPRAEDSYDDILEVENSLSLSRDLSTSTISSSTGTSPATKRPRLESWVPTIDEDKDQDDAMLGLIWSRYFQSAEESDGEYTAPDMEMEGNNDNSDSEGESDDLSILALTRRFPDNLLGFIKEATLYEANRLAEEGTTNQSPNPPPNVDPFPIHSFGTAAERPPVPLPRPVPQAPRRLHRSNERITIDENGVVTAFDYTQTEAYAARVAWERHLFIVHERLGRRGPCDLAADLREIAQVGPGGQFLDCHRWRYRFDEQAWRSFEVPS
ncbi:unnamed protein product [Cyclocybe aegerita]|uniref:Uncharacterized protein n=1 Tax=Cyclocybe aegerita TaxID=1973307 RepID=A0A8S0VU07_CYCAE|nr:unnamed protein product [Cyclocybe aegerita]